jgi:transposase
LQGSFRILVQRLLDHLKELDRQVDELESQIVKWHRQSDASSKLAQVPGIGPITASALVASICHNSVVAVVLLVGSMRQLMMTA